ncbi:MAG: DNA repair protein RadC [Geminicoccaceae bacterium]
MIAPLLVIDGVTISRDDFFAAGGRWLIRGATLELEETLLACGCSWSAVDRAWTADTSAAGRLIDRLQGEVKAGHLDTSAAVREQGLVTGWGHEGLPGAARQRRLNRLARLAPEDWDDGEVLEILVGFAFPDQSADLAAWLLERFGGIGALLAAETARYAEHPTLAPIGYAGAPGAANEPCVQLALLLKAVSQLLQRSLREQIQDRPVIGSWTALLDYLQAAMQHEAAEHFRLLFLDRKNILIRDEVQSRGTVDHTPLYPREVLKRALELGASALIMVHNHPSGDPTPSQADIEMTRQVVAALSQVNITVHDHIIVGKNRHTSFKTQKLI